MRAALIINPRSGRASAVPIDKEAVGRAVAASCGIDVDIAFTTHAGHGRELARQFADAGADTVIAWGGDGTVNEVAGAVAGTGSAFGIVPAGSGDGFATTLGIARDPHAALRAAFTASTTPIDVGDVNGHPFLNLAGIGFDARVARRFNTLTKRGGLPYLYIGLHEGMTYRGARYRVHLDDEAHDLRAFLIVFANGQQYGNNAIIAPGARFDDGLLDALVVDVRRFLPQAWRARRLFLGRDKTEPGLVRKAVARASVESDDPIEIHLDGECISVGTRIDVTVRRGALKVRM